MAKQFSFFFATVLFAIAFSMEVKAQWLDGKVAVRTNGNNFQSGDQLKVELLPLELINERFYTQVTYRFNETVEETDKDGKVTEKQVEKKITRQASPALESLKAFQMITLDDSFHFGDASPTGRHIVEAAVLQANTNTALRTLRTSVIFQSASDQPASGQPASKQSASGEQECDTFLRALKTVHHEMFITFDGKFNPRTYYTVTFLNRNKVV